MELTIDQTNWKSLTLAEKQYQLYINQMELLDKFLERNAISKTEYDKCISVFRNDKTFRNTKTYTLQD